MPSDNTPRQAVNRALAAMEIAESCPEPKLRESFTELAQIWLAQAEELGRGGEGRSGPRETPPGH